VPFDPSLRERLCELEPQSPHLRERYNKELRDMLEKKLSPLMKLFLLAVAVTSVAIAIFLGSSAFVQGQLPPLARLGLAGGAVFALAWAALTVWALRRGTWSQRAQPAALAALSWVFAVLLETTFLLLAPEFPDHFHAIVALFAGLVILIGAGVMLVATRIQQAELQMRESLLRLEYRLAELAENRPHAG
jgi:MFS family permease